MQVDPIKPVLNAPETKRLKLRYDNLLSSLAFSVYLRRYSVEMFRGAHAWKTGHALGGIEAARVVDKAQGRGLHLSAA